MGKFEVKRRVEWIDGDAASLHAVRMSEREKVIDEVKTRLLRIADEYEKDGEVGPRGYNMWGWRDIARELRKIANEMTY